VDGDARGDTKEGLLLVHADLAWDGTTRDDRPMLELTYRAADNTLELRRLHFLKNETRQLVRVPAGSYRMTHAYYGFSQLDFPTPLAFSVRPGEVTYLGHFQGRVGWPKIGLISDRTLRVTSRPAEAQAALKSDFPLTSANHAFASTGLEQQFIVGR
jgi:hypothetical protein